MAVVSIPGHEPQRFRKHTVRELFARAGLELPAADDKYVLDQASALEGLYFDTLENGQRQRIAAALRKAADAYRAELLQSPELGESDQSRAEALGELSLTLTTLASGG